MSTRYKYCSWCGGRFRWWRQYNRHHWTCFNPNQALNAAADSIASFSRGLDTLLPTTKQAAKALDILGITFRKVKAPSND